MYRISTGSTLKDLDASFLTIHSLSTRSRNAFLMIIGTIGAIGNGLSLPLMTVLFGQLSGAFGQNQNNKEVVRVVSEVSLRFVYLALGAGATSLLRCEPVM